MANETGQKIPLGVGRILSDSFSILFRDVFRLSMIAFIPAFAASSFHAWSVFSAVNLIFMDPSLAFVYHFVVPPLNVFLSITAFSLAAGLAAQLVNDARLNRRSKFGIYLGSVIPAIIPIMILTIAVVVFALFVGVLTAGIGALWVWAVFSVIAPAAAIERAGFGAMRRSEFLTKEYRWPIAGVLLVVATTTYLLSIAAEYLATYAFSIMPFGLPALFVYVAMGAAIVGPGFAYGGIIVALIYARLRDIKEGGDPERVAAAFD